MSYVGQFVDGDAPTGAELNALFPVCVLYKTGGTLTGNTTNTISFTSEVRDSLGWHDNSTNSSRITVDRTGFYRLNATVKASGALGTAFFVRFWKNGTTILCQEGTDATGTGSNSGASISWTGLLESGDYVEFLVRNGQATARTSTFVGFNCILLGV